MSPRVRQGCRDMQYTCCTPSGFCKWPYTKAHTSGPYNSQTPDHASIVCRYSLLLQAAALYQHQLRFNRQATGRGHPAARTVSFAPDTLGGREHEEYGEYGASPTRVPYMARFGPEAAAVRSLAAMVAQRAQEGGVGASGLGDTRLPRDARDGSGGWGLGREGEDVSEEYDKTDPHADTECGGCDFPACPVRAAQEEDRQAEDARQVGGKSSREIVTEGA